MKKAILLFLAALCILSCETKVDTNTIALAIEQDDLYQFEKLISKVNLDTCKFDYGENALHYALKSNSTKIASKLIDDDFMLNKKDSLNFTPLLSAINSENKELTNKILQKNVALDVIEDLNGFAALHYAVYTDDYELVDKLISKKADVNLKSSSITKSTPLHLAIEKENGVITKQLLDNKAIDTIKDVNNNTAIDLSAKSKNAYIIKLFYDKMSQDKKEDLFINTVRNSGDKVFLEKIVSEDWITKQMINDALVFAKDTAISKLLINKGASVKKLHSRYDYGAIHYAAIRGNVTMLVFLLKQGANINQLAKQGTVSPLMYASQLNGELEKLNKNVEGLNISINSMFFDLMGKSAEKNKKNSMETVSYLIGQKADLNFKNKANENALYYAVSSRNDEVAAFLKESGVKETKKFVESTSDRINRALRTSY